MNCKKECMEQNKDGTLKSCPVIKDNTVLRSVNENLEKELAELKAEKQQIQEQVKKILLDENAENGDIRKLVGMDWYDVKEIEQLKYNLKCRDDELAELKAHCKAVDEVNEKMKCGGNCKHSYSVNTGGCYDTKCELTGCDCINCKDKWELAE